MDIQSALDKLTAQIDAEIKRLQDVKSGAVLLAKLYVESNQQHSQPSGEESREASPRPSYSPP